MTFEDLIEEIVGTLYDEYDANETELIEKIKENQWAIQRKCRAWDPVKFGG